MASGPKKSPEEIVRSYLRAQESALWWHGEYEPKDSNRFLDRIRPFSKAIALVPVILLLVFRGQIPFLAQMLILSGAIILFLFERLHAWLNKEWRPIAIITDQRVWLSSNEIPGRDIERLEQSFGFNGTITFDLITRKGDRFSLPSVDINKSRKIIETRFLGQGSS